MSVFNQPVTAVTTLPQPLGPTASPTFTGVTTGIGGLSFTTAPGYSLHATSFTLTSANILAMYATPVQVIPPPGAGYAIVPVAITGNYIYGGTKFTGGGGSQVNLSYGSNPHGAGQLFASDIFSFTQLVIDASSWLSFVPINNIIIDTTAINAGIYVSNTGAAYTGAGNGSIVLYLTYAIVAAS